MRVIAREVVHVVAVALLALLLTSFALGTLAIPAQEVSWSCVPLGPDAAQFGWVRRTMELLSSGVTLGFCDSPITRGAIIPGTIRAAGTTGLLVLLASVCSTLIAVPLGMRLAMPGSSVAVRITRTGIDAISSLPVLVWCTLLFVVLARGFGVIPGDARHPYLTTAVAVLALVSGDRLLAELVQRVESATSDTLSEPYMRTVRAGGFGVRAHLARSLVSPVATAVLSRAMFLVSGAIIVELIFDLPGLGSLIRQSLGRATPDPKVALAATMALIAFGTVFRATRQSVVWLVDRRVHR